MNVNRFIGAKGQGVQIRLYLRNREFKAFVDRRIADLAALDGVTSADEMNEHLARTLLPKNEKAAEYVYRLCTDEEYRVARAMGDVFAKAAMEGGTPYLGMRDFVGFFADVARGICSWPSKAADRSEAARSWRKIADRIAASADGAPVDVRFDILSSAEMASQLAYYMGLEDGIPSKPGTFVRVILRNWAALRAERSTYEFLAALVAECPFSGEDGPEMRVRFQELAENLLAHWDAGEVEPGDPDPMAQIRLSAGDYVRVPRDFVLLNAENAEGCSDAVVIELTGAGAPHFLFFTDDPLAVVKDRDGRQEEVLGLVKRALDERGDDGDALRRASFVGYYRLPEAVECRECPPCGAAVYRIGEELPLFRGA